MSKGTDFFLAAVALIVFTVGALTLIGWDSFETDRDDHRNMMEGQTNE